MPNSFFRTGQVAYSKILNIHVKGTFNDNVDKKGWIGGPKMSLIKVEYIHSDVGIGGQTRTNLFPRSHWMSSIVWKQNIYRSFLFQDGESRFLHKFESNQETEDPILQQFTQIDASIFNGKSAMIIVALTLENLENYQALWRNLIRLGRDHFGRHIY